MIGVLAMGCAPSPLLTSWTPKDGFSNTADVANDTAFTGDLIPLPTVNKLDLDHGSGSDDARTSVNGPR